MMVYGREADAKYSVGDIIRVKEYENIKCLAVSRGANGGIRLPSGCYFTELMKQYCGKEYIRRVGSQKYCCKQCCERAKKKHNKAVCVK